MKDDDAKARYFSGLSIFMFSMTGIVLADNFLMMFMFWELVGFSSYLLIGHWFQKESAADAAKKAFLANRVGDFGFLIGILMLWQITGALSFSGIADAAKADLPLMQGTTVMGIAVLCIFCGAIGKSAQAPLHVWLPDAMEGPTPVSALIHAATMVAAGVYMMARLFFSLSHGGDLSEIIPAFSSTTIAWVGAITALLAALMATQQDDIKKILAYSTLSQLGYMIMAVGLLNYEAGMFHLYTHAWFKALLFLGAGAIIYACHHEQNIWKMGGLFRKMPITGITFLIGTVALMAVPGSSGFFSKEEILIAALNHGEITPLFCIAAFVALLTAFYMSRAVLVTFFGKARGHGAEEAKEVGPIMFVPLLLLAVLAIASAYVSSTGQIDVPGMLSALDPRHAGAHHEGAKLATTVSLAALLGGVVLAFLLYAGRKADPLANNPLMKVFRNKFYFDELYAGLIKVAQDSVAALIHFFDEFLINGLLVGGLTRLAGGVGGLFRRVQSGNLQTYSILFGGGIIVVIYLTVFYTP